MARRRLFVFGPLTRGECRDWLSTCLLRQCRYNIHSDVKTRAGYLPVESCSLNVAEKGGATLQEVADLLGVTREAVRLMEMAALKKLHRSGADPDWMGETTPPDWIEPA